MELPDSQLRRYWLGIDGGGTHTRAVLVETGPDNAERTLGKGQAEAANLNRVGLEAAVKNVVLAVTEASSRAEVAASEITAACVGLAGVQHPKNHRRMLAALKSSLPVADLKLETDARVALAGATDLLPGVVIIAGTGSISCGVNARGKYVRAGGWGPTMGDEGSGHYIGKRALEAVMGAYDHRKPSTRLTDPVCRYLGVSSPPELPPVIYDLPGEERRDIAQLSKIVVEAGRGGDIVALEILNDAAAQLARAATTVINQLEMSQESFRVAYVGGVFDAGELILAPLRRAILAAAPHALLAAPLFPPVIGAVKLAQARHMVRSHNDSH
jgi:N-acetylglucosamine kinase-like BadF-type ATPase